MYEERPSRIQGGLVWTPRASGAEKRILPDGCMDLLWDGRSLSVAGADTHAQVFRSAPGAVMTGLRFAPGLAPFVLGVAADEVAVLADSGWSSAAIAREVGLSARQRLRRPGPPRA